MNEQLLQSSFTLGEIKDKALELTKKHWTTYLLIGLVGLAVIAPIEIINTVWQTKYEPGFFSFALSVVSIIFQIILGIAVTRYALAASEDRKMPLKEYFRCNLKMIIATVIASLLYVGAIVAGLIALVVPGIILSIAFSFYAFPIVEKNAGPLDALEASWRITKGNRMNVFVFSLAVAAGGFVVLVVPFLIAIMPLGLYMQGARVITGILGSLAFCWMVVAGIALETFTTIASALMYRKMQATRK